MILLSDYQDCHFIATETWKHHSPTLAATTAADAMKCQDVWKKYTGSLIQINLLYIVYNSLNTIRDHSPSFKQQSNKLQYAGQWSLLSTALLWSVSFCFKCQSFLHFPPQDSFIFSATAYISRDKSQVSDWSGYDLRELLTWIWLVLPFQN